VHSDKHDTGIDSQHEAPLVVSPRPDGSQPFEIIDLRFIILVWLKWSWIALPLIAIGVYVGFRDIQSFRPVYSATMTVAPAGGTSAGSGQVSSVLGDLGLSLGGATTASPFDRLKVMLGSITLARRLQDRHGMLQVLFAGSWDANSDSWIEPPAASDRDERLRVLLHRPEWSPPNLETLAGYVSGSIKTGARPEPGFVLISFSNEDRDFALEFLTIVFSEVDALLREQDVLESEARREYILNQLSKAKLVDSVRALNSLLLSEERSAMLLGSGLPYAGRIVEPPFVSTNPSQPNIRLIFGFPIFVSLGIGFVLLTLIAVFRRE